MASLSHATSPLWVDSATVPVLAIPVHVTNRYCYHKASRGISSDNFISIKPTNLLPPATTRIALLNVRSLSNKSFICQDIISSNKLDMFFVTETWLNTDVIPLVEATPPDYSYLNQPRVSGRGGGVAVIYRNNITCSPVSLGTFTTFELLGFVLNGKAPMLCIIVYRPPSQSKAFLSEFSELLTVVMPRYDRLLILGDFNIHVCCPTNSLATDFLHLIDSFNLVQSVTFPTHVKKHILVLVLSSGLSLSNLASYDICVSDHKAILFETGLPVPAPNLPVPTYVRILNSATPTLFSSAYTADSIIPVIEYSSTHLATEALLNLFHTTCLHILDSIAPLKVKVRRKIANPWLDESTCSIHRECRKAERKWAKDGLQVSYEIYKDLLFTFQSAARDARTKYLSDIIVKSNHNSRILFNTINSAINSPC